MLIDEPKLRERTHMFRDRTHPGEMLAIKLERYRGVDGFVLAIPSGGVPVGYVLAKTLGVPLELAIVRKIFIPGTTEAGYGAASWDGETALNRGLIEDLGLTQSDVDRGIEEVTGLLRARNGKFRSGRPPPRLGDKLVILTDDGLASGYTMLACLRSVRRQRPTKIVVAVPTGSRSAIELILPEVDELVCQNVRGGPIFAVADAYKNWYDLSDEEVLSYLSKAKFP